MSRLRTLSGIALVAAMALSGFALVRADEGTDLAGKEQAGGKPEMPPYQMRAEVPAGDRLHPTADGQALFSNLCGACHLAGGMATLVLTAQQVAQGNPPSMGLLANRDDLIADYVKAVVRSGKGVMPIQTRVDITDAELDKVATYLGRGK